MRAAQVVMLAAVFVGCAATATPRAPETVRWDAMTAPQKLDYMKTTVMPQMQAVFAEFDRHRYPRMSCATCHGDTGEERAWKMPNPDLLLESPEPGHHGSLDAFMKDKVAPEMARMLGRKPDCFSCHTLDR